MHFKVAKWVDFKSSHHKDRIVIMWGEGGVN